MLLSFNATAAHNCGDDLGNNCWDCSKTEADLCTARKTGKELSITGTGQMKDYILSGRGDGAVSDSPWGTDITKVVIGEGITTIGDDAFIGAVNLEDVQIASSVTTVGHEAFYHTGIQNLVLSDSIDTIENYAFQRCYDLVALVIPSSVTSLGEITFENSSGTIYCAKPAENESSPCEGKQATNLKYYTKDENTGIYEVDGAYYADVNLLAKGQACENKAQCDKMVLSVKRGIPFEFKGKFYTSFGDIATDNYIHKRIYTVDEANMLSGKKNTLKIRYK